MVRKPRPTSVVVDVLAEEPVGSVDAVQPEPQPEPVVEVPPARPAPDAALSPEQLRIRDLENMLALERGRKDPEPELAVPAAGESNIIIHFINDGFTALGQVWRRGQELEFAPNSRAYHDTCDRQGRSWLRLVDDPAAQEALWKEVKFRRGPWPGKKYADAVKEQFDGAKPTEEELRRADEVEARRRRAAPLLPAN